MKFHAALAQALVDQGTHTLFGVLGDGNLFAVERFVSAGGGRYVAAAHEGAAVLMADGYAQATRRVGVATVTHGPALTNTVTALVEAVRSRTPLVLVAGDTSVSEREHLQNIDQREIVTATGAGFEAVRTADSLGPDVARAFRRAQVEARPIVLNVPVEFQWEDIAYAREHSPPALAAARPDPAALDTALGVIASTRRPILLAGRGATAPAARRALLDLAQRIDAPVGTTLRARDLFRNEPRDLGIIGTLATTAAQDVISRSDCIIAFGAGLNRWTTMQGALGQGRSIVHVDIDPAAIGDRHPVTASVVGDAAAVALEMISLLDNAEIPPSGFGTRERHQCGPTPIEPHTDLGTDGSVDLRTALDRIDAVVPPDRTVAPDGGRFLIETWRRIRVEHPDSYVHAVSFGALGSGLAVAIGAAVGRPGHPVLHLTGDGGFMMGGVAEFATAVREKLDLIVIVLNDSAYGAEHVQLVDRGLSPQLSLFTWPDFADVARALGGQGATVRMNADLDRLESIVTSRTGPLLVDVRLDPTRVPNEGH